VQYGRSAKDLTAAIKACTGTNYGAGDTPDERFDDDGLPRVGAGLHDSRSRIHPAPHPRVRSADEETLRLRVEDARREAAALRGILDRERAENEKLKRLAGVVESKRRGVDEFGRSVEEEDDDESS
jgi:hypothetical protein